MHSGKRYISLLLALIFLLTLMPTAAFAESDDTKLKIAIISDPHYLPSDFVADTEAFHAVAGDSRPLLAESSVIFEHYLDTLRDDPPDVLLIPGDLSGDGGMEDHIAVASRLAELKTYLPELKIYVINGNHDVNRVDSRNYNTATGEPVAVPSVTPAEFCDIYDFVYEDTSV